MTPEEITLDLLARLHKASGSDPELDRDIQIHLRIPGTAARQFTGSLECAMSLIPKDSSWGISHSPDHDISGYPKPYRATIMPPLYSHTQAQTAWHQHSATLALVIACLMVRMGVEWSAT
jgi:hypothetical protein